MLKQLLKQIANSNHDDAQMALEEIYYQYGKLLLTVAKRILKDLSLAEEVLNDVLMKVWLKAKSISKLENPLGYLVTMAYNGAIDYQRRKKDILLDDIQMDEISIDKEEKETRVSIILEELSRDERSVLILKHGFEYRFHEIAKILNLTYKQTRNRYQNALKKFNEIVAKRAKNNN